MGRRERKTDSVGELTKRGSFFSPFFFAGPFSRPQALPQEKAFGSPLPRSSPLISTSHQQEDRLAPVTRVELGKLKVRRLFWRRAEPRTKQGERDLIVVDRESERERQGRRRQARESRAGAGALGFRAPLNLGPPLVKTLSFLLQKYRSAPSAATLRSSASTSPGPARGTS